MHFKLLYSLIFIIIIPPIYIGINYIQNWINISVFNSRCILDDTIPFIPLTIWIYLSFFYILYPLILIVLPNNQKGKKILLKLLKTIIFDTITSSIIFLNFPVKITLRDNINYNIISSKLTKRLILTVFNYDTPFSSWPSLHVSQTVIISYYMHYFYKNIFFNLLSIMIIISTLTIKQHYIWDVITGIIKGCLSIYFFNHKK